MSQAKIHHTRNRGGRDSRNETRSTGIRVPAWNLIQDKVAPVFPTFVAIRTDPKPGEFLRDFWCVQETGNWSRDIATGRAHARDALRFLREERASHVLNWIASEMIQKRRFGPIEVGFFHELGALVLRTGRAPR